MKYEHLHEAFFSYAHAYKIRLFLLECKYIKYFQKYKQLHEIFFISTCPHDKFFNDIVDNSMQ